MRAARETGDGMKKRVVQYLALALVLLGVPWLCARLGGRHEVLSGLKAFPPRTEDWGLDPAKLWNLRHPFSWPVFSAMAALVAVVTGPFLWRLVRAPGGAASARAGERHPFPAYGWWGVALGTVAWVLAWARFPWFAPFQAHTFLPLWLAYILVMNALCVRRSGRCLMTGHPRAYAVLFPVSAAFWWFFEYLNRYVWNWYYLGLDGMSAAEYTVFASFSFATVLPAVTATAFWLGTFRPFGDERLCRLARMGLSRRLTLAALVLTAGAGLTGIVFVPHLAYPLLWISPLTVFLTVQITAGDNTVLDGVRSGDWRVVVRFAAAALICGLFWEMWNFHSAAKWVYAVPYVQAFQLFEMPALGFAGYLPFGLECAAVAAWVLPALVGEACRVRL